MTCVLMTIDPSELMHFYGTDVCGVRGLRFEGRYVRSRVVALCGVWGDDS